MNLALPAILIVFPLVLALATLLTARWARVSCGIGIVGVLILGLMGWIAAPESSAEASVWNVAGRMFELTLFVARVLALLAFGLALLFVLQWLSPGLPALVPGGLAALGLLAAALTARPFALGAVGLLAAAAVAVPSLASGRPAAAAATWRAFLPVALATPLLVGAGWLLDAGQGQGEWAQAVLLLASLLLLGGFPFHMWLTGIAREAPLQAVVLFVGLIGAGIVVWLGLALDQFPVARGSATFQTAVLGSVLLSVIIAAFGLSRAAGWRENLAYGLVFDAGLQVASLLVGGPALAAVLAVGAFGRAVALLLLVGLAQARGNDSAAAGAPGWRRAGLAYGGLSLLGLPLTAAFAARWATLAAVAGQSAWVLLIVLAALGLSAVAIARWAVRQDLPVTAGTRSEPASRAAAVGLFILALLMGLLSPTLLEYLARLAGT